LIAHEVRSRRTEVRPARWLVSARRSPSGARANSCLDGDLSGMSTRNSCDRLNAVVASCGMLSEMFERE